jgi:vitamin B12 transporter
MQKEKKVWAMCSVLLGMFTTGQAIAQQDTIKSYGLQEVVITATKFPKSRSETGKVLNIITQEQLAQSAGKDLSQLLNEQVGLVVGGANSNPGKDKSVFLRGAGSE